MMMAGMSVDENGYITWGTLNPIMGHVIGKKIVETMIQKRVIGDETAESCIDWAIEEIEALMIELGYTP